jgi:hypothetical protein
MTTIRSSRGWPSIQWAASGRLRSTRVQQAVSLRARAALSRALVIRPTPQVPLSAGKVSDEIDP